jgi:hypothetical protein
MPGLESGIFALRAADEQVSSRGRMPQAAAESRHGKGSWQWPDVFGKQPFAIRAVERLQLLSHRRSNAPLRNVREITVNRVELRQLRPIIGIELRDFETTRPIDGRLE